MEGSLGVRRGAWTEQEDNLLRRCIEKYGEQKWHLVPQRTGLKRCRKSCRLRWLNYLKPDIKRGKFEADEVDLMLRLHTLLGNRWTLIAGRLPGRTANDVKNYWNTHLRRKPASCYGHVKAKPGKAGFVNVIKPRPRNLFKGGATMGNSNQQPSQGLCKPSTSMDRRLDSRHDDHNKSMSCESLPAKTSCSGGDPLGNLLEEGEASLSFWNDFLSLVM